MIPYIRYLHCLRLKYPNDEDSIIKELVRFGLPHGKMVMDISYDAFLAKLDKTFPGLSSCLFMELEEDTFKSYARELDVDRFFNETAFVANMFTIAGDPLIKKHVECSLISRIGPEVMIADINEIYHIEVTLDDILLFERCFFDTREIYDTNSFTKYADMLADDEKGLKCKCRAQGPEYTRWAIGASVKLDTTKMTNDMIADAYFRYRAALSGAKSTEELGNAIRLGNLVSKLIDKEVKLKDKAPPTDKNAKEAFGEQLCLFNFEDEEKPTAQELNSGT